MPVLTKLHITQHGWPISMLSLAAIYMHFGTVPSLSSRLPYQTGESPNNFHAPLRRRKDMSAIRHHAIPGVSESLVCPMIRKDHF
jgi:hypothetical protein